MLTLEDVGLTKEDAKTSPWNIFEYLTDEEEITTFLQGTILSIEAEDCEPSHLLDALAIAAKARIINQLAKDASIDRRMLCNMFQDSPGNSKPPTIDQTTIIKIAHSFAIPVPTLHKELITT